MTGMSLAPICIFFGAHYYFFWKLKNLGKEIQLEPDHIYFRFLEGQSQQLFLIFLLCSVLGVLMVFILGLLLSHKVAGPIYRLKGHLKKITAGEEAGNLFFREKDFFKELPPLVNESFDAIKKKK